MAEEKTVALDCDQYEDFKEEFIKAFKAEIAKLQSGGDNTALMQRIDEIARVQFVSREVEKYKEILDGHWSRINSTLDHLLHRIPYNYDINKRLVRACV